MRTACFFFFLTTTTPSSVVVQAANTLYVADNGMKASVNVFANMFAPNGASAAFTVWGGRFDTSDAVDVVPGIPDHYLALNDIADIPDDLDADCNNDNCQLAILDYDSCDAIAGLTVETANHIDLDSLDARAYDPLVYTTDSTTGAINNAFVGQPAGAIQETTDDGSYALYIAQDFKGNLNYYIRSTMDFQTTLVGKVAVLFGKDGTSQYCGTIEKSPQAVSDNLMKDYFQAYEIACSKANSDSIDRFECNSWEAVNSDDNGDDDTSDAGIGAIHRTTATTFAVIKTVVFSILLYGLLA